MAGMENLRAALQSGINITTGAVRGTLEIVEKAASVATKTTQQTIDVAGVLGSKVVEATQQIGTEATKALTDVSNAAITQGVGVAKAGIETGATIAKSTLDAAENITKSATEATADIASTALETGASNVTTTTKQVGDSLNAAVNLAGHSVTWTLQGVENIGKIVAGRGAITVQSTLQKQGAEVQGVTARMSKDKKDQLLKAFEQVQKQMMTTVSTLHGVQKTALAAQMNIYKRAKCGFFRRVTGFCDSKTISKDSKLTDLFLNDFKTVLTTAYQTAKVAIAAAPEADLEAYRIIENEYLSAGAGAVKTFVASYKALLDKYNKLTREALGAVGGRRMRRTFRRNARRISRASRASRKRPSARGRSA